jgi:hypothetical protein
LRDTLKVEREESKRGREGGAIEGERHKGTYRRKLPALAFF